MLVAAIVHVRRSEFGQIAPSVVLGALSAFVAYSHLL